MVGAPVIIGTTVFRAYRAARYGYVTTHQWDTELRNRSSRDS